MYFFIWFLLSGSIGLSLGSIDLLIVEAHVKRVARVKFLVCAARSDLASVEYQNTIRVLDRAESVSYDQHSAAFRELL